VKAVAISLLHFIDQFSYRFAHLDQPNKTNAKNKGRKSNKDPA